MYRSQVTERLKQTNIMEKRKQIYKLNGHNNYNSEKDTQGATKISESFKIQVNTGIPIV